MDHDFYFRAMSVEEYELWKEESELGVGLLPGTEWIADEERGYGLKFLKEEWVDRGLRRRFGDLFAIIVGVKARESDGFSESPFTVPIRYTNSEMVGFERLVVVYDPRGALGESLDMDLEEPERMLG